MTDLPWPPKSLLVQFAFLSPRSQIMEASIDIRMVFSAISLLVTAYFWFVKARKERPNLQFYQLGDFQAVCRRRPDGGGGKRLCLQQLDTGGVLIVNHSTRQNSIVLFDCLLRTESGVLHGDWGYSGDDKPPWNIGPESTIAFSPACFFDVPDDFEVPDELGFEVQFITASGKRFSHHFMKRAPRLRATNQPTRRAA
jgi:hypothetical protein